MYLCFDCAYRRGLWCQAKNENASNTIICPFWIARDYEEETDEEGNTGNGRHNRVYYNHMGR